MVRRPTKAEALRDRLLAQDRELAAMLDRAQEMAEAGLLEPPAPPAPPHVCEWEDVGYGFRSGDPASHYRIERCRGCGDRRLVRP